MISTFAYHNIQIGELPPNLGACTKREWKDLTIRGGTTHYFDVYGSYTFGTGIDPPEDLTAQEFEANAQREGKLRTLSSLNHADMIILRQWKPNSLWLLALEEKSWTSLIRVGRRLPATLPASTFRWASAWTGSGDLDKFDW